MNIDIYYSYQAKARNMLEASDVLSASNNNSYMWNRILSGWLPVDKNSKICEVACGAGIFMHWLANQGYSDIEGSDLSENQLNLARNSGLNVKQIDALSELRLKPDDSVNCVVALDFYEHLTKEDFLDFLHESYRVLKKDGRIILRGPNGGSPFLGRSLYNDITHQFALTPVAFEAILKMFGFTDIQFKDPTIPSIVKWRFVLAPLSWLAQVAIRMIAKAAVRENITFLSPSIFLSAKK
jgi:2-polyprenyl-3-methyl-5-hydroxy-6-metoxy-1,4-benzoquinol methylase